MLKVTTIHLCHEKENNQNLEKQGCQDAVVMETSSHVNN